MDMFENVVQNTGKSCLPKTKELKTNKQNKTSGLIRRKTKMLPRNVYHFIISLTNDEIKMTKQHTEWTTYLEENEWQQW